MNDTQLYLAIGLAILAVLTSLTVSMTQISGIREDVRELRRSVESALADYRKEAREDRLQIAADIKTVTGKVIEIDNRLTRIAERIEPRQ
jgi:hypothetical protein